MLMLKSLIKQDNASLKPFHDPGATKHILEKVQCNLVVNARLS